MEKKRRKHLFEELGEMLKTLQEIEKIQDRMVRKFQELIQNKDLSSSAIEDFSYPMVIFEQDGDLVFVNSALSDETGLCAADLSKSKHSLFNRITDANLQILDAAENVFTGKTTFLTGLSDPLDIFMSDRIGRKKLSSEYKGAVFFPIIADEGKTSKGAVIFMK